MYALPESTKKKKIIIKFKVLLKFAPNSAGLYAFVAFDLAIVETKNIGWFGSFSPILKNVTVRKGVNQFPLIFIALLRVAW